MSRCKGCANLNKNCYRCGEHNNFEFFKAKAQKKYRSFGSPKKSNKEGMAFQRKVVDAYNDKLSETTNILSKPKAQEQINSGAIWHMPGDVITEEALMECKERGTVSAKGEKQISIKKDWLDKIAEEALSSGRAPLLPFGFKNDEEIYVVAKFDLWLELVQTIDILKARIQKLEGDNNS